MISVSTSSFTEQQTLVDFHGTDGVQGQSVESTSVSAASASLTDSVVISKAAQTALSGVAAQSGLSVSVGPATDVYGRAAGIINDPASTDAQKVNAYAAVTYSHYLDLTASMRQGQLGFVTPETQGFANFHAATQNSDFMKKVESVVSSNGNNLDGSQVESAIAGVGKVMEGFQSAIFNGATISLAIDVSQNSSTETSAGSASVSQSRSIEVGYTITPEDGMTKTAANSVATEASAASVGGSGSASGPGVVNPRDAVASAMVAMLRKSFGLSATSPTGTASQAGSVDDIGTAMVRLLYATSNARLDHTA